MCLTEILKKVQKCLLMCLYFVSAVSDRDLEEGAEMHPAHPCAYTLCLPCLTEILKKVRKPPPLCRPSVSPQAAPPHFIQTMKQCWSEMPDMRPTVEEVYEQFKKLSGGK